VREVKNAYTIFLRKTERKRLLGRPRCRWEDNIRTNLKNRMGSCGLDSPGLGHGQLAGSCGHGNEHSDSIKGEELLAS
jgi:hypothetical protein